MTPEEGTFVSLGTELIEKYVRDEMCKSCKFWNPHSVKLQPATCMNPFNDKLINIFNPHGFDYNNIRQAMFSEKADSCKHYEFEENKYDYLQQSIDDIKKKYGIAS